MERITIGNKTYSGDLIFNGKKDDIEVSIYILNPALDKYLILNNNGSIIKDFVITGIHKVYEIMEVVKDEIRAKTLEDQVVKALQQMKSQCYVKNLKRTNLQKLRDLVVGYYDNNYPTFIVLGVKFPELIRNVEREGLLF